MDVTYADDFRQLQWHTFRKNMTSNDFTKDAVKL